MLAPSLLRAGLALKVSQIKRATRSYLRDRTNQATNTVTSYAIAAALFAAAGILVAACLVGVTALFRWIETNYGLFYAFGVVAGLLLVISAICAGVAFSKLRPQRPRFPSLTSRLRAAINANPLQSDQIEAARDTAAAILSAPPSPSGLGKPGRQDRKLRSRDNNAMPVGLILLATLLGWAAVRRRQLARQTAP
jgi:hypothetical protein